MEETRYSNYNETLESDAHEFTFTHFQTFLDLIKDGDKPSFSVFLHDDGKLNESMNQYLNLHEAFHIINNCEMEADDTAMWEGLPPKEAVIAMAFYSYRNDLQNSIRDLFIEKLESELMDEEERIDILNDEIEEAENEYRDKIEEVVRADVLEKRNELERISQYISLINEVIDEMGA